MAVITKGVLLGIVYSGALPRQIATSIAAAVNVNAWGIV